LNNNFCKKFKKNKIINFPIKQAAKKFFLLFLAVKGFYSFKSNMIEEPNNKTILKTFQKSECFRIF
jgi:hypothetical protein